MLTWILCHHSIFCSMPISSKRPLSFTFKRPTVAGVPVLTCMLHALCTSSSPLNLSAQHSFTTLCISNCTFLYPAFSRQWTLYHTISHCITLHQHYITCLMETKWCRLDPQNGPPRLLDSKFHIGRFYVEIFIPVGSLIITGCRSMRNCWEKKINLSEPCASSALLRYPALSYGKSKSCFRPLKSDSVRLWRGWELNGAEYFDLQCGFEGLHTLFRFIV